MRVFDEGYGELLRRVGETLHQSCLVLTSREKPRELVALEGDTLPVRSQKLGDLKPVEGREILKAKGYNSCSESEWIALIEYYAGNPQVLKIVATTIQVLFEGDISKFLKATLWPSLRANSAKLEPSGPAPTMIKYIPVSLQLWEYLHYVLAAGSIKESDSPATTIDLNRPYPSATL